MTLGGIAAQKLAKKRSNAKIAAAFPNGVKCQKCLEYGHWSYECKGKRKYLHRSSRTKQLNKNIETIKNKVCAAESTTNDGGSASKRKIKEHGPKKSKRKKKTDNASSSSSSSSSSDSSSSSSSDDSDSSDSSSDTSDSDSDSSSSSDSDSSSSDSE